MRRLNESASWLSDVSEAQSDVPGEEEAEEDGKDEGKNAEDPKAGQRGDGSGEQRQPYMNLAEALNESMTWIDADISCSERDEREEQEEPEGPGEPYPSHGIQPVGYRQGVARSFSM